MRELYADEQGEVADELFSFIYLLNRAAALQPIQTSARGPNAFRTRPTFRPKDHQRPDLRLDDLSV